MPNNIIWTPHKDTKTIISKMSMMINFRYKVYVFSEIWSLILPSIKKIDVVQKTCTVTKSTGGRRLIKKDTVGDS